MPRAAGWAVWCRLGICLAILWEPAFAQQTGAGGNEASSAPRASPVAIPHSQSSLNAPWRAVGPAQIASQSYGNVTGRVTAIAIDPADASGNTVYLGTTGATIGQLFRFMWFGHVDPEPPATMHPPELGVPVLTPKEHS